MDQHAIVINKPPGLATQGGIGITTHVDGLLDALQYEMTTRPKLVHRLDKDTSGVLLLARTARAAAFFSKAFAGRDAQKTYWALTIDVPKVEAGEIDAPLSKQPGSGGEKMHVDTETGLKSKTRYRVIDKAGGARRLGGIFAADRAHPPDPRPCRRDRPSARRRCQIWRQGSVSDRWDQPQAAPARPAAGHRCARWRQGRCDAPICRRT